MSNFEHRITEDSTEFEKAFLKIYDGSLWTALDKMKDWQPPKPLVVVPQYVADWFDINQDDIDGNIKALTININRNPKSGWSEMDEWFMYFPNKPIETLISMKLYGYTVEKEKLFYLRNKITRAYLFEDAHDEYFEYFNVKRKEMDRRRKAKFTQSEIDGMDAGSYEQIEVKNG